MTPKKRLFLLKKELLRVKRKMDRYNKLIQKYPEREFIDVVDKCFPKYINSYTIITSDKKRYIINCFTEEFPITLNFCNIVYINKTKCFCYYNTLKNGAFKRTDPNWIAFDSYTGKMMTSWNPEYDEVIAKKFPYTETIGDYED